MLDKIKKVPSLGAPSSEEVSRTPRLNEGATRKAVLGTLLALGITCHASAEDATNTTTPGFYDTPTGIQVQLPTNKLEIITDPDGNIEIGNTRTVEEPAALSIGPLTITATQTSRAVDVTLHQGTEDQFDGSMGMLQATAGGGAELVEATVFALQDGTHIPEGSNFRVTADGGHFNIATRGEQNITGGMRTEEDTDYAYAEGKSNNGGEIFSSSGSIKTR